jgi:hypothetical protein
MNTNDCLKMCCNCIDNDDGSTTCLGLDNLDCHMEDRFPANDIQFEAVIRVNSKIIEYLFDRREPSPELRKLLLSPSPWEC